DGKGNTFFDDNAGEFHAVSTSRGYPIVQLRNYNLPLDAKPLALTDEGVKGQLFLAVADLDYDKEIALVATTDNWATVMELGVGSPEEPNRWYWVEDAWTGYENWAINVDLPGEFETFEYAVVY